MNAQPTLVQQLQAFGFFALVIVALGSFEQTHMIAVFILAFCALAIVINFAKGSYSS